MFDHEAKILKLPGSDKYESMTHMSYIKENDINRDAFVIHLNRESFKAFNTSITVKQKEKLLKYYEDYRMPDFGNDDPDYFDKIDKIYHINRNHKYQKIEELTNEYSNLENVLISTGFELSFKARLLENNYVLQIMSDKNLKEDQKKRPIHTRELFDNGGFIYDSKRQMNILKGIEKNTINYSYLFEQDYKKILNFNNEVIELANNYRKQRNNIHLPSFNNNSGTNIKEKIDRIKLLSDFINSEIVIKTNNLINKIYGNIEWMYLNII